MSVTALYKLHGIATTSPSGFISQITNARPTPGITVQKGIPAGLPGARFIYNIGQNADFTFDCTQVKSVLDYGLGLTSLSAGTTDLYFKLTADLAASAGGSTAIRLRAAHSAIIPMNLTASNDSPATISTRIACAYDGTNEPIVPAGSQAIAGTPSHAENFVVGPASINAVSINGIQDVSIDFATALIEQRGDGELYLTWITERERLPVVTIRTTSNPWAAYGINGFAVTGFSAFLRKCGVATRVANGTAEHINFTGTAGYALIRDTSGGGNDPAITTIEVHLAMPDESTAPLLVDTTAAIA